MESPEPGPSLTSSATTLSTRDISLLHSLHEGDIVQIRVQDEHAQCVTSRPGSWTYLYDTSPSGQWLLVGHYSQAKMSLYLIDMRESATPQQIAENVAWATWMDDDRFLFWNQGGELYLADRASGEKSPQFVVKGVGSAAYCATTGTLALIRPPRLSPQASGLYVLDILGSQEEKKISSEVATLIEIMGYQPLWSPDCRSLLILVDPLQTSQDQTDALALVNVETGQLQRLETPLPSTPLYLSRSGQRLFYGSEYMDSPSVVWVLDLDWQSAQITAVTPMTDFVLSDGNQQGQEYILANHQSLVLSLETPRPISIKACDEQ